MEMKTRDEILAAWEEEGRYTDWYAIDSYDPIDGKIRRLFVGTEGDAIKMMRDYYGTPTDLAQQPFRRCSLIGEADALAFFKGEVDVLPDERGVYSITEAAGILDVSRQRVHKMIQDGKLDARKVGNTWTVYRYSVEARLAGK